MGNLSDKIKKYTEMDYYPFHMPGHKRRLEENSNIFSYDITEIDGFDNLHNANGIIADINKKGEKLYNSENSFIMVNGSTGGILAAISSVSKDGGRIILARNSHKSAYNGVFLNRLKTSYVYPQNDLELWINGSVLADDVEKKFKEYNDICGVFITSPTYEGVVSDIEAIVRIAHKYNIPVIVDEAHGAHFAMNDYFPKSAVNCGADIVIQSLHKTLPAVTQTAIVHFNSTLIDLNKFKHYLTVYQSSSPSYLFMISIENCIDMLLKNRDDLFNDYINHVKDFRNRCSSLKYLRLFSGVQNNYDYDSSRIVISTVNSNITGFELYNILQNKYKIQLEMALYGHVIAITSCMDTADGFNRLFNALEEIDGRLSCSKNNIKYLFREAETKMSIFDALNSSGSYMEIENAIGHVSCEFMYVYPPGIPLIAPGEEVTSQHSELFGYYKKAGAQITGNSRQGFLKVITSTDRR